MPDAPAKKPRVRLDDDEAWRFLEAGHTGILTSLRRDGAPIALPVWYVVEERTIYVGGPSVTRKFARMRRDPRVSFLVERGRAWRELAAVQVNGRVRDRVSVPADASEEAVREAALASERVAEHLDGHEVARVVYVPGRLLNIVLK